MFLGAGSVINGMHHEQDMRKDGRAQKVYAVYLLTFMAGWLAICGINSVSVVFVERRDSVERSVDQLHPMGWIFWL